MFTTEKKEVMHKAEREVVSRRTHSSTKNTKRERLAPDFTHHDEQSLTSKNETWTQRIGSSIVDCAADEVDIQAPRMGT